MKARYWSPPIRSSAITECPAQEKDDVSEYYESDHIHARAIVAQDYSWEHSHWQADRSLAQWLEEEKIPEFSALTPVR